MSVDPSNNGTNIKGPTWASVEGSPVRGRTCWSGFFLAVGMATMTGCGAKNADRLPVFPVEGLVTLNGQPLPNAFVVLHPKGTSDSRALAARGQTDQHGQFKVTTYDAGDGAPAGEYAVTVEYHQLIGSGGSLEPGPNVLPPKYASPDATDLSVRVAEGPNTLPPIELRR